MCRAISDALDSMYQSSSTLETHLASLVGKILRKDKSFEFDADEHLPPVICDQILTRIDPTGIIDENGGLTPE